jgi:nucleoside-diphosphate-sugar epimerase
MEEIRSLVIGGSGLVGGEILKIIKKKGGDVSLLSRSPLNNKSDDLKEYILNFNEINEFDMPKFDHIYISIGTRLDTSELIYIKESKREKFIEVDYSFVINIAKKAFTAGAKSIAVVSAIGADKESSNLYLQTKGKMEEEIKLIGYETVIIAQPGHLLGDRPNDKFRFEVLLMEFGAKLFKPLMGGPLKNLRFISAFKVGKAMFNFMNSNKKGIFKLKYEEFMNH